LHRNDTESLGDIDVLVDAAHWEAVKAELLHADLVELPSLAAERTASSSDSTANWVGCLSTS